MKKKVENCSKYERFDVWQWLPEGWHEKVGENLDARAAVELAHSYTTRPAALIGIIEKVQIVSRLDDATVFLWERGKLIYPTQDELKGHEHGTDEAH